MSRAGMCVKAASGGAQKLWGSRGGKSYTSSITHTIVDAHNLLIISLSYLLIVIILLSLAQNSPHLTTNAPKL